VLQLPLPLSLHLPALFLHRGYSHCIVLNHRLLFMLTLLLLLLLLALLGLSPRFHGNS
jgi:hypothetical protein